MSNVFDAFKDEKDLPVKADRARELYNTYWNQREDEIQQIAVNITHAVAEEASKGSFSVKVEIPKAYRVSIVMSLQQWGYIVSELMEIIDNGVVTNYAEDYDGETIIIRVGFDVDK